MWLGSIPHQITYNILWMNICLKKLFDAVVRLLTNKAKGVEFELQALSSFTGLIKRGGLHELGQSAQPSPTQPDPHLMQDRRVGSTQGYMGAGCRSATRPKNRLGSNNTASPLTQPELAWHDPFARPTMASSSVVHVWVPPLNWSYKGHVIKQEKR